MAVVRIFRQGGRRAAGRWLGRFTRFYQWIDYRGEAVTTKRLVGGETYKVCLTGLWRSFTLCSMDVVRCEGEAGAEGGMRCGRFMEGRERMHLRRYAERAKTCG